MDRMKEWGPWRPGIDPCERRAQLRGLRAITRLYLGPRGADLCDALACAENDGTALGRAMAALDRLASLDRRKVLGSFAEIMGPPAPCTARTAA